MAVKLIIRGIAQVILFHVADKKTVLLIIFLRSGMTPILSMECPFPDGVPYSSQLKILRISTGPNLKLRFASIILCRAMTTPAIMAAALDVPENCVVYLSIAPFDEFGKFPAENTFSPHA
jgi:hypothetical protein